MPTIRQDFDETARLILMDDPTGLIDFAIKMQEVHPNLPLVGTTMMSLWKKYRGWDGRIAPTHDYMTGERFMR